MHSMAPLRLVVQGHIWTEPLILPAQIKHASWMYQTSNKTKSGHRRQQEHLEQIYKSKYLALTGLTAQTENGWCGFSS